MFKRHRPGWSLFAASLTVAALAAWVALAPVQIGGPVAYVIVNGNSMEPLYGRGDLVLTRRAAQYAVGDIVAYQHPQVGLIIHRIAAERLGRFVMRGDHNTWFDSYRPGPAEVLGRAWVLWPGAGQTLNQLRQPAGLASLAVVLAGSVMLTTISPPLRPASRRGRRHARRMRKP